MKKMQIYRRFLVSATAGIVALLTSGVFFAGCQKEKEPEIPPSLALSASTLDFQSTGGAQTFTVTSNVSVWNITSGDAAWLTVTPTNGSNNGTVTVTADANTAITTREATITVSAEGVATQTVKVTQAAVPVTLALSKNTLDFQYAGGTQTFAVTSNASAWNVTFGNASWLTVTPASGSNDGTVTVVAAANTVTAAREATITVSATGTTSQTVKVTQAAPTLDQAWRTLLQSAMNSNPTHSYSNGTTYKGQTATVVTNLLASVHYVNGEFNIGTFNYANTILRNGFGIVILGDFDDNYIFSNCPGSKIYVGNWSFGQKSGMGAIYDKTGARLYYGEFKDEKPVGTYPSVGAPDYNNTFEITRTNDGSYYLVENVQGKRSGYGIILYANRDIWYGPWKDGVRDGYGIQIYANGALRVGTWKGDAYTATTRSQSVPTVQQPLSPVAAPALGAPFNEQ